MPIEFVRHAAARGAEPQHGESIQKCHRQPESSPSVSATIETVTTRYKLDPAGYDGSWCARGRSAGSRLISLIFKVQSISATKTKVTAKLLDERETGRSARAFHQRGRWTCSRSSV